MLCLRGEIVGQKRHGVGAYAAPAKGVPGVCEVGRGGFGLRANIWKVRGDLINPHPANVGGGRAVAGVKGRTEEPTVGEVRGEGSQIRRAPIGFPQEGKETGVTSQIVLEPLLGGGRSSGVARTGAYIGLAR